MVISIIIIIRRRKKNIKANRSSINNLQTSKDARKTKQNKKFYDQEVGCANEV